MDKFQLQNILSDSFDLDKWRIVLADIFNVRNFLQKPLSIQLPKNNKVEEAFELGSFNTTDDRIIGLYLVKVKPSVWLERNKVGLRELLRSVYKYEVDGALIVFEQEDKWRLSFVSEIRSLNDDGDTVQKITEPKRYTYLLGRGEKTKTPVTRLSSISGKPFTLEDIRSAFSVEALNEEFYKIVSGYFYQLVGATEGKGSKEIKHKRVLKLPGLPFTSETNIKTYKEFAVRLIGRIIFCWFLKVKKSDAGISLLPESLLSSDSVKRNSNYYHNILERLFFQILNTPQNERLENLPFGSEQIPFLNGGLFEPNIEDYFKSNSLTGLSEHYNTLEIPDNWFKDLFENLEQYNFTIDENSIVDIEVSVDPEMLGRIFENLLAEIDPDREETARKTTGSFYTPRKIVDFMATESLVNYLTNETNLDKENLYPIFNIDSEIKFSKPDTEKILEALSTLKILDPACGSGAFPMGILQKIITALQKLDKNAEWWKAKQIERIENPVLRKQIKDKFELASVEYARKIGVIQNTLYGVDIQPIAAEISKLRCFLTLIVDENIDETKLNRGVEPLPNLEFKFVTADALQNLPEENNFYNLFDTNEDLEKLQNLRQEYLQSYGEAKKKIKDEFKVKQNSIAQKHLKTGTAYTNSRAYKISQWNPFSNENVDWFNPIWMFGVDLFDIVIGNPPYIKEYTNREAFNSIRGKKYYQGKMDLWYAFSCYMIDILKPNGIECFIAQNNWITSAGASILRNKILTETELKFFIDFGNFKVFKTAGIQTMVYLLQKTPPKDIYEVKYSLLQNELITHDNLNDFLNFTVQNSYANKFIYKLEPRNFANKTITFNNEYTEKIISKIIKIANFYLNPREVANGIHSHFDFVNKKMVEQYNGKYHVGEGIFGLSNSEKVKLELTEPELKLIKPYFTTEQFNKYYASPKNKLWIIYTDSEFKNPQIMKSYPNIKKHLDKFKDVITSDNKPYGLHRAREERFFLGEKIIAQRKCPNYPIFTYTNFDCYVSATFYIIKTSRVNQKYLIALLNSKLIEFWLRHKGKMQGNNFQIDKEPLLAIPIIKTTATKEKIIVNLVEYILLLLEYGDKKAISLHFSNEQMLLQFVDVIDALIYELYFAEDFQKAEIEFMQFAEKDFQSIENLKPEEKILEINTAFTNLQEKDNKIRQNLKLMDTRLRELIFPIKTGR